MRKLQIRKWMVIFIIFTTTLTLISNYFNASTARKQAKFNPYKTRISPNKEYKIEIYYISFGEPMELLFLVFDKNNDLLAKHTRAAWPGAVFESWTCEAGTCTAFIFETGDAEPISLPPTWLDRLLAKIP